MEEYIFEEKQYDKLIQYLKDSLEKLDLSKISDRKLKEDILSVLKPLTGVLNCQYDEDEEIFAVMLSPTQIKKLVDCMISLA